MTNLFPPLDEAAAQIIIPLPDGTGVELEDGILFRYDIDPKLIGACQLDDYPDPDGYPNWVEQYLRLLAFARPRPLRRALKPTFTARASRCWTRFARTASSP